MDMTTKEQVKVLWKQCLEDGKVFVDLRFKKRCNDEINAVVERNGGMVSALQMIPYTMNFCGKIIPLSYISGACTHPACRELEVMEKLLADTHRRMFLGGSWLSILVPANKGWFDYYAQWGYESVFNYSLQIRKADELQASPLYTIVDEKNGWGTHQVLNTKQWLDLANTGDVEAVYQDIISNKYFQRWWK